MLALLYAERARAVQGITTLKEAVMAEYGET
jgi:hypothetical protein